ncbi:MAG: hypothetical protein HC837_16205 [Chloroflexaceae bacterium]|nr:hypothetical protein [Chloroflexaceae bacterium]
MRRLWRSLVLLSLMISGAVWPVAPAKAQDTDTFICDNLEPCYSVKGGNGWREVTDGNPYAEHARWTLNEDAETDYAIWEGRLDVAGIYEVAVWYPERINMSNQPATSDATYEVRHADGIEEVHVDQQQGIGQWNVLAEVPCPAGDFCHVRLSDETSEPDNTRLIWFDAVRFRLLTENVPPVNLETAVSPITATVDTTVTFTATLSAIVAQQVDLMATLPEGLRYQEGSVTGGADYDADTRQIRLDNTIVETGQTVNVTYRAEVSALMQDGSILQSRTTMTNGDQAPQYRTSTVVVANDTITQILIPMIIAVDNDLADEGQELFCRLEQAASNDHVVILAWIDGPAAEGDSYLYRVRPASTTACTYAYDDPTAGYTLGQDVWQMPEEIANPYTIAGFLTGVLLAYPNARQVMPVMVGHGSGISANGLAGQPGGKKRQDDPLAGLLFDEHPAGTSLSTQSLGDALRWSLDDARAAGSERERYNGMFFDACLMGMVEVAYEVRNSVDLLLSSSSVKWATFRYDQHIGAITSDQQSARAILTAWLDGEIAELAADSRYPYTYALIDLRQLDNLRQALDALAEALRGVLPEQQAAIESAAKQIDCFDNNSDGQIQVGVDTYCDLASLSRALATNLDDQPAVRDAAMALQTVISDTVLRERHQSGQPWLYPDVSWNWQQLGGLSIYTPLAADDWKRRFYTGDYFQIAADGQWDDFLMAYWGADTVPPETPTQAGVPTIPPAQQPVYVSMYLPLIQRQ